MLGKTENWRVWIFWASFEVWAVSGFDKKIGHRFPLALSDFFYLEACKELGKTENRQVWIDFPYPKEIFLAQHLIDIVRKLKKPILASATEREPGSFLQSGKRLSVGLLH